MGYIAQLPRPAWPSLANLPREEAFYPAPDPSAWRDNRHRRQYRRHRIDRHRRYLHALPWSHTMLGADIRQRLQVARCDAERAWLLDEELTRRFEHRRPRFGLCGCELHFSDGHLHWWPYPEDEWEPHPED